jgi:Na+/melibiose symporter-like transporter
VGAAVAASCQLDRYHFPQGYTLCFAAAGLLIFISWVFLSFTRELAQANHEPDDSRQGYWRRLPTMLLDLMQADPNFRRYLLSQIVITIGRMAVGFLTVYAVQQWHLTDSRAGGFTAPMLVGQALSNLLFGMLADRWGHKLVLDLSTLSSVLGVGLAGMLGYHGLFAVASPIGLPGLALQRCSVREPRHVDLGKAVDGA